MCSRGSLQKNPPEQIPGLANSHNLKKQHYQKPPPLHIYYQLEKFCKGQFSALSCGPGFPPAAGCGADWIQFTCQIALHTYQSFTLARGRREQAHRPSFTGKIRARLFREAVRSLQKSHLKALLIISIYYLHHGPACAPRASVYEVLYTKAEQKDVPMLQ